MIRNGLALLVLSLAGCAELPGAAAPQPATIRFFAASSALCGPDSPICEARVNHVDGRPVLFAASMAVVPPGRHVVGLFCRFNPGIMIGDAQSQQREAEAEFDPGGRYRVEARMEPRACTMTLIDEATGRIVGTAR